MIDVPQLNVRVPKSAHDLLKRVARLLREDSTLQHHLARFLDEHEGTGRTPFMMERIERLEARVAEMAVRLDATAPRPPSAARQLDMLAGERPTTKGEKPKAAIATDPSGWAKGEGKGRRLTSSGMAELRRRIEAGETDKVIADALGVRPNTVTNQRKAMAEGRVPD